MTMAGEEIAIIGVGCRFPGAACLEEFWGVLSKGENHVVDIPPERWNMDAFYDSDRDAVGKSYAKRAGLVKNVGHFDNKLFRINEEEASKMDPQQHQVLECTYMALEDAGIIRQQISGQKVGVYLGCMSVDYGTMLNITSSDITSTVVTGQAGSIVSNRVSYAYNLTGPSMTIDTACSSSLVAIHTASQALRANDCSMAICGGVNLLLLPDYFIKLSRAKMLSPTGQCHAFSAQADGYTRGEGCGIVIIKTLSQALHDGDYIWATIKTGLNQDGRNAKPITAPSGQQQEQLLRDVYDKYNIDPADVDYIEAHGTGTARGDPVEATALGNFFHEHPKVRYIGSVKTNIGHLEGAAGIAGLIKVLLMMKHGVIVPSLHFKEPNADIDLDRFKFIVPTSSVKWDRDTKTASVNSFGFGGTNSHAIVTSFQEQSASKNEHKMFPICFSGSTFVLMQQSLKNFLNNGINFDLADSGYTSCVHREHFRFRKAFVTNSHSDLSAQIQKSLSDTEKSPLPAEKRIIFIFCGMGTAWEGMCKDLIQSSHHFEKKIEELDRSLGRFVDWSLKERLLGGYDLKDPVFGPIAIFCCQVAIAHLWKELGVSPNAVVGQSIGEVAAAHVAGMLSLDEAVRVIYHRSNILAQSTGGKMLLIRNVNQDVVKDVCAADSCRVQIALIYSPVSCSISGDEDAVSTVKTKLLENNISSHSLVDLDVTSAFHSHHMESAKQKLDTVLADLEVSEPKVTFIPAVDPSMPANTYLCSSYWGLSVRNAVLFGEAVKASTGDSRNNIFVEVGPRPVLKAHLEAIFNGTSVYQIPSLQVNGSSTDVLKSACTLYEYGIDIVWKSFWNKRMFKSSYPAYSFNHKPLMLVSDSVKAELNGTRERSEDHLFYRRSGSCEKLLIDPLSFKSIFEHKVKGSVIIPGATYVETGLVAAKGLKIPRSTVAQISVTFKSPVNLKSGQTCSLDISGEDRWKTPGMLKAFQIKKENTIHAVVEISSARYVSEGRIDLEQIRDRCSRTFNQQDIYRRLEDIGFRYGERLTVLTAAASNQSESLATIEIGEGLEKECQSTVLHPAIIDGMFQSSVTLMEPSDVLPYSATRVTVLGKVEEQMLVHIKRLETSDSFISFVILLLSTDGYILARVEKFTLIKIREDAFDMKTFAYSLHSQPIHCTPSSLTEDQVLVFSDEASSVRHTIITGVSVHSLHDIHDELQADNIRRLTDLSAISVLYTGMPESTDNGEAVERETEQRIMPLRELILGMSRHALKVPLVVVTTTQALLRGSRDSRNEARICIHEAIRAFFRCVQGEFTALTLKCVDINIRNQWEDSTNLLLEIGKVLNIEDYSEFEVINEQLLSSAICHDTTSNPAYRKQVNFKETDCTLHSTDKEKLSEPFLCPSSTTTYRQPVELTLTVQEITVHSASVAKQVVPPKNDSPTIGFPVLSLESVGFMKLQPGTSSGKKCVICYPHLVKPEVHVPQECVIKHQHIPQFQTGYLLKLYCLWQLCSVDEGKVITVLYSKATRSYAHVLSVLLHSRKNVKISLKKLDELKPGEAATHLISTVQISENIAQVIAKMFTSLRKLVTFEELISPEADKILRGERHELVIGVIRLPHILSRPEMKKCVPELFKWIKKQKVKVIDVRGYLDEKVETNPGHHLDVIDIAELLETSSLPVCKILEDKTVRIPEENLFNQKGAYIVVGGLTGLGWECVTYLASRGAGHVVILGRRTPTPDKWEAIMSLKTEHKGEITFLQADVTKHEDIKEVFAVLTKCFPDFTLKGIFFGAGVLEDGMLVEMGLEKFRKACSPKVAGSWNFHLLTQGIQLDYFVFFSSVVSVWGSPGQGNYGAGNGFLDALAHVRRDNGLSGQTVNLGPLNIGMMTDKNLKQIEPLGYIIMKRGQLPSILTHLLMMNKTQSIMCGIQPKTFGRVLQKQNNRGLLAKMMPVVSPHLVDTQDVSVEEHKFSLETIKNQTSEQAYQSLIFYVRRVVIDMAMLDDSIDIDKGAREQGVDSMNFMQITGKILDDTNIQLSATQLNMENASVKEIAASIQRELMQTDSPVTSGVISLEEKTGLIPGESFVFSNYLRNPDHVSHLMTVTIELPDVATADSIQLIAEESVKRHPISRTVFLEENGKFSRKILDPDAPIDFRVVSSRNMPEITKNTKQRFFLDRQGPIRFVFVKDTVPSLCFVFHRIAYDYQGILLILNEFLNVAGAYTRGVPFEEVPTFRDDPVVPVYQDLLKLRYNDLKAFWQQSLERVPDVSLSNADMSLQAEMDSFRIERELETDLLKSLNKFTTDKGVSHFQCLVGLFQLLLYFRSGQKDFAISTYVDLRIYSPKIATSVARCVNFTALVCTVPQSKSSVVSFLKKNAEHLEKCKANGLFPSEDLQKLLPDDQVSNMLANFVIFGDDEFRNKQTGNDFRGDFSPDVDEMLLFGPHTELYFDILNRKQSGKIVISLNARSDRFSEEGINAVIDAYFGLLQDTLSGTDYTLEQLSRRNYLDLIRTVYQGSKDDKRNTS